MAYHVWFPLGGQVGVKGPFKWGNNSVKVDIDYLIEILFGVGIYLRISSKVGFILLASSAIWAQSVVLSNVPWIHRIQT